MEIRAIGVILTILGVIAITVGGYSFLGNGSETFHEKVLVACLIVGVIFFASGISLVGAIKDVMKNDGHRH